MYRETVWGWYGAQEPRSARTFGRSVRAGKASALTHRAVARDGDQDALLSIALALGAVLVFILILYMAS
jgi:hypothetical protein